MIFADPKIFLAFTIISEKLTLVKFGKQYITKGNYFYNSMSIIA